MLCFVGLFLSQQTYAQRGRDHGKRIHKSSKSFKKNQKNYRKGRVKAYKKQQKKHAAFNKHYRKVSKAQQRHYSHNKVRNNARRHYYKPGRRIVKGHVRSRYYRAAPWAARHHYGFNRHVYFPDYHAFYDARRHGYVYRNGGRWIFTQTLPRFMVGLNWNNVRIQYLQGVPVTAFPQTYYDTYSNRYPAVSLNLNLNL